MKFSVNLTLYALFATLFLFDGFLGVGLDGYGLQLFPKKLSYLTELISCVIALLLIICFSLNKSFNIRIAYLFFFFFFLMHALLGIVFNTVPSGAVFSAIRRYFAFMPLFFLPIVYEFSDKEIKNQLKFLLVCGLAQCPVAVFQRFVHFRSFASGDLVTGTLLISSILSLYQICCITVLMVFYLRKRVGLPLFLFLAIILFLPTTLNETKGTIILFPIALSISLFFGTGKILSFKKIALISTGGTLLVFIFLPFYNYLYPQMDIVNFFKGEGEKTRSIQGYLYKEVTEDELGEKEPGRIDVLLYPFKVLSKNPFKLAIGLGMGNVNPAGIRLFSGEHKKYEKYRPAVLTASSLIWEIGLIGFFLQVVFLWLVLKDAVTIRSLDDTTGYLAAGWIGIIVIIWMSFFYKSVFHQRVIVYLFWYLSGLIAARRARLAAFQSSRNTLPIPEQNDSQAFPHVENQYPPKKESE
jgi:hypothetical protein